MKCEQMRKELVDTLNVIADAIEEGQDMDECLDELLEAVEKAEKISDLEI